MDEVFDIVMACLIPGSIRFDFEHHLLSYISRNLGCLCHPVGERDGPGIIQQEIWLWVSHKANVQLFRTGDFATLSQSAPLHISPEKVLDLRPLTLKGK